jgi:hypothetical protein
LPGTVDAGGVIEIGGPRAGAAGVVGEVGNGVAELLVARPAEGDGADPAGLAGGGCGAGEAGTLMRCRDAAAGSLTDRRSVAFRPGAKSPVTDQVRPLADPGADRGTL